MRTLVTLLAAALVLASCERPSADLTTEAEAPKKTVKSFVAGSRLMKTGKAVPGRYIVVLDEKAMTREAMTQDEEVTAKAQVGELANQLSALHAATVEHALGLLQR